MTPRIYYGSDSIENQWPWFFSIGQCQCDSGYIPSTVTHSDYIHECLSDPWLSNFCGGAIISPSYGLTALHCFRDSDKYWFGGDNGGTPGNDDISAPNYCVFSRSTSVQNSDTSSYKDDLRRIKDIFWPESWKVNYSAFNIFGRAPKFGHLWTILKISICWLKIILKISKNDQISEPDQKY